MHFLDAVQWPAMMVTVLASWLVASQHQHLRKAGFWVFLASNLLWVVWGWHAQAYALIALQVCLLAMNIRGARENEPDAQSSAAARVASIDPPAQR